MNARPYIVARVSAAMSRDVNGITRERKVAAMQIRARHSVPHTTHGNSVVAIDYIPMNVDAPSASDNCIPGESRAIRSSIWVVCLYHATPSTPIGSSSSVIS